MPRQDFGGDMRIMLLFVVIGMLTAACGGSPAASPTPVATKAPVLTPTWTPVPTSTDTPAPTSTWTPTAVLTSTTTPTATATSTETLVAIVDASAWRLHVGAAGLTVAAIEKIEWIAQQRQAGTLQGIEVSGRLLGVGQVLDATDEALAAYAGGGRPDAYAAALRENIAGTLQVISRWLNGETTSATVPAELTTVRAASEQTLSEITDELRGLGVSDAQIGEFLAEIGGAFDVE